MKVNFRIVVFCCLLAFSALLLALPESAVSQNKSAKEQRMKENRGKREKVFDKIRELNQERGKLEDVIAIKDGEIDGIESEISNITTQLDEVTNKCDTFKAEQVELERKISEYKTQMADRARSIYMQGEFTYLEMVLQSSSFGDAIDRLYFVQTILDRDRNTVTSAEKDKLELGRKLEQIEIQIGEIDRIRQILEDKRGELEHERGEKQLIIEAINSDKALLEKQAKEFEEENKRIAEQIRQMANVSSGGYSGVWKGSFNRPCSGEITSGYGMRFHPIAKVNRMHAGIDIGAPKGTAVKAAGDGKVISTGWRNGYGKTVIIDHGSGKTTLYAHLSRITCDAGNNVSAGTKIGEVGNTGYSTGNHLHFEVRVNGEHVDPFKHL